MKKRLSKEERQQMAREKSSKLMTLAHQLKNEEGLSMSYAMKLAHLTDDLLYWLRRGKVYFTYFKATKEPPYYETRLALGTLCEKDDAGFKKYLDHKRSLDPSYNNDLFNFENGYNGRIIYWDIKKQGFRTCKVANLMGISSVIVKIDKYIKSQGK